jgi:hypothetical protein
MEGLFAAIRRRQLKFASSRVSLRSDWSAVSTGVQCASQYVLVRSIRYTRIERIHDTVCIKSVGANRGGGTLQTEVTVSPAAPMLNTESGSRVLPAADLFCKIIVTLADLTPESFLAFVSIHRYAVIHFWAVWNGYDLELKQFLEQRVPVDLRNQIAFGSFDVDPPANWEICRQHELLQVPFLAFYREGTLVDTLTGKHDEGVVVQHLRRLIA